MKRKLFCTLLLASTLIANAVDSDIVGRNIISLKCIKEFHLKYGNVKLGEYGCSVAISKGTRQYNKTKSNNQCCVYVSFTSNSGTDVKFTYLGGWYGKWAGNTVCTPTGRAEWVAQENSIANHEQGHKNLFKKQENEYVKQTALPALKALQSDVKRSSTAYLESQALSDFNAKWDAKVAEVNKYIEDQHFKVYDKDPANYRRVDGSKCDGKHVP